MEEKEEAEVEADETKQCVGSIIDPSTQSTRGGQMSAPSDSPKVETGSQVQT